MDAPVCNVVSVDIHFVIFMVSNNARASIYTFLYIFKTDTLGRTIQRLGGHGERWVGWSVELYPKISDILFTKSLYRFHQIILIYSVNLYDGQ